MVIMENAIITIAPLKKDIVFISFVMMPDLSVGVGMLIVSSIHAAKSPSKINAICPASIYRSRLSTIPNMISPIPRNKNHCEILVNPEREIESICFF